MRGEGRGREGGRERGVGVEREKEESIQTTNRMDHGLTRKVSDFKRFGQCLVLVIPDVNIAIVEAGQHPWLLRVQIETLDSV